MPYLNPVSAAWGREFLRLDQFLKFTNAKAEENVPNPKAVSVMTINLGDAAP